MARQSRQMSKTGIYHVMLRGNERKNIFGDREDKQCFLDYLRIKQSEFGFEIYGYCLMDNHVHLLIKDEEQVISTIMKGLATRYASFYNWKYQRVGHVFQDRFKSEPVEDERYLLAVLRYIHNNPIKAGIIRKPEDYEWSSYGYYVSQYVNKTPVVNTEFIMGLFAEDRKEAIKEFQNFSCETDDTECMDMEDKEAIRTVEEGRRYLEENWKLFLQDVPKDIKEIRENTELRKKVISYLRTNTRLSQRKIAEILGVDKSVVEKVKM